MRITWNQDRQDDAEERFARLVGPARATKFKRKYANEYKARMREEDEQRKARQLCQ